MPLSTSSVSVHILASAPLHNRGADRHPKGFMSLDFQVMRDHENNHLVQSVQQLSLGGREGASLQLVTCLDTLGHEFFDVRWRGKGHLL